MSHRFSIMHFLWHANLVPLFPCFVIIFFLTHLSVFLYFFLTCCKFCFYFKMLLSYSSWLFLYSFPFLFKCHLFVFFKALFSFFFSFVVVVVVVVALLSFPWSVRHYMFCPFCSSLTFFSFFCHVFLPSFRSSCLSVVFQELITIFLSFSAIASLKLSLSLFFICSFIVSIFFSVLSFNSPIFLLFSHSSVLVLSLSLYSFNLCSCHTILLPLGFV